MKRRIIYRIASIVAIAAFIVISLAFTSSERKLVVCSNVQVLFYEKYQFVQPVEIEKLIKNKFKGLIGSLIDTINTNEIELLIEEHPWVKRAEVFKGYASFDSTQNKGGIKVYIEQEQPILRVVDGANGYYVTQNGKKVPFSRSHTSNLLVFTGTIKDNFIENEIIPFVNFLEENSFWKAQIQQVHVKKNGELLLVPRVGGHKIEFGFADNIEKKFRNLKAVYQDGFSNGNWNKYKTVTLKYDNQVICKLK